MTAKADEFSLVRFDLPRIKVMLGWCYFECSNFLAVMVNGSEESRPTLLATGSFRDASPRQRCVQNDSSF